RGTRDRRRRARLGTPRGRADPEACRIAPDLRERLPAHAGILRVDRPRRVRAGEDVDGVEGSGHDAPPGGWGGPPRDGELPARLGRATVERRGQVRTPLISSAAPAAGIRGR